MARLVCKRSPRLDRLLCDAGLAAGDRRDNLHGIAILQPSIPNAVQHELVVDREVEHRIVQLGAKAVQVASGIGLMTAVVIGLLFVVVPQQLLGIFGMTDPVVLDLGGGLLRYLSVSGLFITVALTYTGGLQGTGDTRSPLYISVVSQILVPLSICAAIQATRGLQATDIWLAILVGHFTRCTLSVVRFRQGKWRDIVVDIEPARA